MLETYLPCRKYFAAVTFSEFTTRHDKIWLRELYAALLLYSSIEAPAEPCTLITHFMMLTSSTFVMLIYYVSCLEEEHIFP